MEFGVTEVSIIPTVKEATKNFLALKRIAVAGAIAKAYSVFTTGGKELELA